MSSIGPGDGSHVVYDWCTDKIRTFRSYTRAYDHFLKLYNRGHDVCYWEETAYGQTNEEKRSHV
jgi:hypothetical protein